MSNMLTISPTESYITWRKVNNNKALSFTLYDKNNKPIAKAKLTFDQLHRYICMNNTMK